MTATIPLDASLGLITGSNALLTGAAVVAAVALVFSLWKLLRLERLLSGFDLHSRDGAGEGSSPDSLRDRLTDLPTRHLYLEMLGQQVAMARRYKHLVGVVLLDLDGLRGLNDEFGVEVGDQILQRLARRLRGNLRDSDFLAHLESDLFGAVVTQLASVEELVVVVQRLIERTREAMVIGGRDLLISVSVGIAGFPADGDTAPILLTRAEDALEQAKSRGGNNLQLFTEPMNRTIHDRISLQHDLRKALGSEQLEVHYQPQFSLADGSVTGCEALVRWHHPERGLLTAGRFIPLAEEIGLMPELGRGLIDSVCQQLALWSEQGIAHLPIAMNLSGRQFQHDDLARVVKKALAHHLADPTLLHVELTESIAMEDEADVGIALPVLREIGVQVCLDDFGTGYSSLSFLAKHPVDVLKIDSSFVSGVPTNPLHTTIVRMTLSLATSLGLGIIAEGVETPAQLRYLREQGCPIAQGFLLGRPMPLEDLEAVVRRGGVDLEALVSAA